LASPEVKTGIAYAENDPNNNVDPSGLKIVFKGPNANDWKDLLNCWKDKLAKNSPLLTLIKALESSKDTVTIQQLTGQMNAQGKQVPTAYTEPTIWGNSIIYIDYGKSYYWNNDSTKRLYSNQEALAHEMMHALDQISNNPRHHGDGFMDDEGPITGDAKGSKCR